MKFKITLFAIFFSSFLLSQNSGEINGRILDYKSQQPLKGATVILNDTDYGTISDENGYFKLKNIQTKSYNISVSFIGFESQTEYNIIIKSVGNIPLIFMLRETSEDLEEVVVIKSQFRSSKETPLSTQTFSVVEIETYPGGNNDITKVVQSMPGVSPSIGGFRNDIIIRGGAPNETVYYLDGIEIPNINHFSTQGSSGGPVGLINVSFIRDVTLSSSSFGAEYDNPLSGVLSFDQREGSSDRFGGNFRFGASEAGLTLEGPLFQKSNSKEKAKTTALFSVRRSYLQFLFELIGLPIRPDYWDYQWKVSHELDKYNSISFIGLGSIDDYSVKAPEEFNAEQIAIIEQLGIIQQRTSTLGFSWKRKYKNRRGFMLTTLSSNRLQNIFTRYQDNIIKEGVIYKNDSHEWETKLRYQTTHFMNQWKWSAGFNFQKSNYANNTEFKYYKIKYNTEIDFIKYGLFIKGSRSYFNDRLDFSIGLRSDEDTFSTGSGLIDNFSPRIAFSYALTSDQKWKLNSSIGRYFKTPTYTMLGYQEQSIFVNKNAAYTRSDHYVIGLEYNLSRASRITIEGFLKEYDQYPVSVIDGVSLANKGGDFGVLGNEAITSNGEGKSYGAEALFQQKLTKNFYGVFAYTYFFSEFSGSDRTIKPSVWDSRHLISFSGGYKLKRNWEISARWRFAGKSPYVPIDLLSSVNSYPEIILDYDRLGKVKLDPYSKADIRFDKKWNFEKISFNFYFEVQNFLAQKSPRPDDYGLNRNSQGDVTFPRSLVPVSTSDRNNTPLPSFGFILYF